MPRQPLSAPVRDDSGTIEVVVSGDRTAVPALETGSGTSIPGKTLVELSFVLATSPYRALRLVPSVHVEGVDGLGLVLDQNWGTLFWSCTESQGQWRLQGRYHAKQAGILLELRQKLWPHATSVFGLWGALIDRWSGVQSMNAVVRSLGDLMGEKARARAYIDYADAIFARIKTRLVAVQERPSVLYVRLSNFTMPIIGNSRDLVELGGGRYAVDPTQVADHASFSHEQLLDWDPEYPRPRSHWEHAGLPRFCTRISSWSRNWSRR